MNEGQCPSGKIIHPNRGAAKAMLAVKRRRRHGKSVVRNGPDQVYRCPFCRGWHITSVRTARRSAP